MHLASALVAGALAYHASAFLIPLEVSKAAKQPPPSELNPLIVDASSIVDLECPGCPFFGIEDTTQVQTDVESKIHLEFGVDAAGALTLNGQSIVPPNTADASTPFILTAPQVRVEDGQQTRPIQLDFAYERLPLVTTLSNPDATLIPIKFTILGLQGYPVKVDTVAIHLVNSPQQNLILQITNIPFKDTPGATTCDTSSKWSVCRLRAIIAARLKEMYEAARSRAHAAKGWVKGQGKGCHGKFGRKGGPGGMGGMHHGHHGHHGHHRHAHRFGRLLHQTVRFFVIPALLGVIGGLLASAVGMLVGQLIAYLWIRFHRGGRRGNASVVEIVIEEDEKDVLIVDGEVAPPQYEDLEVETVVIEDAKK